MATKKKVNKSAWIRSQPTDIPAADLVAKAKKEGIKLTISQVYTARSTAKKAVNGSKAATRSVRNKGDEEAFRRLVLTIGLRQAEALLAAFKRGTGL